MARQTKNDRKSTGGSIVDVIRLFAPQVGKDMATNIVFDAVVTLLAIFILIKTFPFVDSLELPYGDAIKLLFLFYLLYNLPIKVVHECAEFFKELTRKRNGLA